MRFTRPTLAVLVMLGIHGSTPLRADDNHLKIFQQAENAAMSFRDSADGSDEKKKLKQKVRSLVEKSFNARQIAQRDQIEQMRTKLSRAEKALDERETIRERIVGRKVEDLLSDQSADWRATTAPDQQLFDVIGIGDIITIHLDGVIPYNTPNQPPSPPQVNVLKSGRIVMGIPYAVGSDGAVTLPIIGMVEVSGLSVRDAEKKIRLAYISQDVLRPEKAMPTVTLIPKEEARFSAINAGNDDLPTSVSAEGPTRLSISANVSSFADTYGRLNNARELVLDIQSRRKSIDVWKKSMAAGIRDNDKTNYGKIIADLEQKVSTARFRLELEREYIADAIELLKTDLGAKASLSEQAKMNLARAEQLYKSGTASATLLGDAKTRYAQQAADLQKAEKKLDQYQKISKRWREIVGDVLEQNAESKQRVNKGRGR